MMCQTPSHTFLLFFIISSSLLSFPRCHLLSFSSPVLLNFFPLNPVSEFGPVSSAGSSWLQQGSRGGQTFAFQPCVFRKRKAKGEQEGCEKDARITTQSKCDVVIWFIERFQRRPWCRLSLSASSCIPPSSWFSAPFFVCFILTGMRMKSTSSGVAPNDQHPQIQTAFLYFFKILLWSRVVIVLGFSLWLFVCLVQLALISF